MTLEVEPAKHVRVLATFRKERETAAAEVPGRRMTPRASKRIGEKALFTYGCPATTGQVRHSVTLKSGCSSPELQGASMHPHDRGDLSVAGFGTDLEDHLNCVHGHRKIDLMGMGHEGRQVLHDTEHDEQEAWCTSSTPLRVGDLLGTGEEDGFCGGTFDEWGPFRVEAMGADWVVVRKESNGNPHFTHDKPEDLTRYRTN